MADKLISKKFIIAFLAIVINAALVYFGKISDGVYSTVMVATIAAYLTANVMDNKEVAKP